MWLLRFFRYRVASLVQGAHIKHQEVQINNDAKLRYDYKKFSAELGKRIAQLRKDRKLTKRALVIEYGFHMTQIQRIERGEGISLPTLLRVAETFQVPLETLMAGLGVVNPVELKLPSSKK